MVNVVNPGNMSGFVGLEGAADDLGISVAELRRRAAANGVHLLAVGGPGGGVRIRRRDVEDVRAELAELAELSRVTGLAPEQIERQLR